MKKGFTLVELLVVITILAILAGSAIPFIQGYINDSRISKVKTDLDEIARAIAVYETREGEYFASDVSQLAGRYLNKTSIDPWGNIYAVATDTGYCYSAGPDKLFKTIDDVRTAYLPPLALVSVQWVDRNQNGILDNVAIADDIYFNFSRRFQNASSDFNLVAEMNGDFQLSSGTMSTVFNLPAVNPLTGSRTVVFPLLGALVTPGSDTVTIFRTQTGPTQIKDMAGNIALGSQTVIILPQ